MLRVRVATVDDAPGIAAVWARIVAERIHSAVDQAWSADEQACYQRSLTPRETLHVAVTGDNTVVGFQGLDLWSNLLGSMSHAGQLGTFLLPEWRRRGAGSLLWAATRKFALEAGYRKLVIQVRGSNPGALAYYRSLGFVPCGRLTAQVMIDGQEDDEVLMELFLLPR